jgi:large subunit ribosomal protein L6e
MPESTAGKTKKFGKGERTIPHSSQKAQKWYSVEDEPQPKKVSIHLFSVEEKT